MRRWLGISLLLVFGFGITAEILDAHCVDPVADTACVCLCHAPAARTTPMIVTAVQTTQKYTVANVSIAKVFFVESHFHPPKALA